MVPLMKVERKVLEKKRRIQMKALCLKLNSLIPNENKDSSSSKSSSSQLHLLDQAAKYIRELRERVDTLKEMKKIKINNENNNNINNNNNIIISNNITNVNNNDDEEMPVIQVKKVDSNLEVVLVSKLNKQVLFHEVIRVLGEEGAEINNANFSVVGDKIFHTIHSQVNCSGMDFNCPAMLERLQELVHRRDALCSRRMQE